MAKLAIIKRQISSGGVMSRITDGGIDVALVAVNPIKKKFSNGLKNKSVWCLPKGIIEKNENSQITAVREVKEETGLSGEIINEIGEISYWYFRKEENVRFHKTVLFYLMTYKEGSTDQHDQEVDDAQWFTIDEAINKLAYKGEKEILQKAKEMIKEKQNLNSNI